MHRDSKARRKTETGEEGDGRVWMEAGRMDIPERRIKIMRIIIY
jgi:hypothetical protein